MSGERVAPRLDKHPAILGAREWRDGLDVRRTLAATVPGAGRGGSGKLVFRAGLSRTPPTRWVANTLIFDEMVARSGIEPPTRGFSIRCSTN